MVIEFWFDNEIGQIDVANRAVCHGKLKTFVLWSLLRGSIRAVVESMLRANGVEV